MTRDQLSPYQIESCPFCDDKEHLDIQAEGVTPMTRNLKADAYALVVYIVCKICGAHGPKVYMENRHPNQEDTKQAIWEWNQRHEQR